MKLIKTTGDIHRPYKILKIAFGYGTNPQEAIKNLDDLANLEMPTPDAIIGIRMYHINSSNGMFVSNQDVAYGTAVKFTSKQDSSH